MGSARVVLLGLFIQRDVPRKHDLLELHTHTGYRRLFEQKVRERAGDALEHRIKARRRVVYARILERPLTM